MFEKDDENKRVRRHQSAVPRDCSMGVITFKLEWTDHVARIIDLSVAGVGLESNHRIEPGFVWFKDRVGGHRCGVLMWSRQHGSRYRAGVKFVTLSRNEEQYFQEQVSGSLPHTPLRDPEQIIATLIESIKKDAARNQ